MIKKQVLKKLKWGGKWVDVVDNNDSWWWVHGPRWFRVYITMNTVKRIRTESTVSVSLRGKKDWMVQVCSFFKVACVVHDCICVFMQDMSCIIYVSGVCWSFQSAESEWCWIIEKFQTKKDKENDHVSREIVVDFLTDQLATARCPSEIDGSWLSPQSTPLRYPTVVRRLVGERV